MSTTTIYTEAARKHKQKGTTLKTTKPKLINLNKRAPITVYDVTYIKKGQPNSLFYVNDHINKTGKNPLRKQTNKKTTPFYDLTKTYKQHKQGITTTCLGDNFDKEKTKQKNPSTNICNIAILLKSCGFTNITGILINKKQE